MAIPDYQSAMLPLLRILNDRTEHVTADYVEALATHFGLTAEERRQLLPSGKQPVFDNRIAWTATYLVKAGLIDRTGRGRVRITERGRQTLQQPLTAIDNAYLSQFPEFVEFRKRPNREDPALEEIAGNGSTDDDSVLSPDERLEVGYQQLREALAQDLLDRIKQAPPAFFERIVIDLLVAMGYGGSRRDAGQAVGGSGDGGIDGIIKEDRLGLDFVYVQAKRWDNPVGRPTVQAFAGSLEGQRARKGVLITTSSFTVEAKDYVTRIEKRIVLVDGEQLAQHMIDFGVGVADVATYQVKRVDTDYFGDE